MNLSHTVQLNFVEPKLEVVKMGSISMCEYTDTDHNVECNLQ